MTNSQRLAIVRACLTRWLSQQRVPEGEAASDEMPSPTFRTPFAESILVRDGFYCGRRFDAGSHRAIWFLEEDELKIFTAAGQLAEVLGASAITKWAEHAAEISRPLGASPAADTPAANISPGRDQPEVLPLPPQAPAGDAPQRRAA